ncbi:hypothetical protein Patl1_03023 [Pistacia atlantica]|uniref:Uncharacterized protein n=1 Tax=Pistacia atlantica TaxID=434234 RepID=A0ACC1C7I9_9ROSI|nr:hypothetical protein Patl1_03023 [Pistacia atlantica]
MHQLKQIHAQMIVSSRIDDHFAASRLLSFCALSSAGYLPYAIKLFNKIENPNQFMWNTLIRAQASNKNPDEAISLYVNMRRIGFAPSEHTFPFVLKACASLRSLN